MPSKKELNKGKYRLFFCSEVDGLRILAFSPDGTANIFMIRNIPLNYVYLNQNYLSLIPARKLYECYESFS